MEKRRTTREYLPSIESFSKKQKQVNGKRNRKVAKGRKLGKKLWREYYKSIEFISKL